MKLNFITISSQLLSIFFSKFLTAILRSTFGDKIFTSNFFWIRIYNFSTKNLRDPMTDINSLEFFLVWEIFNYKGFLIKIWIYSTKITKFPRLWIEIQGFFINWSPQTHFLPSIFYSIEKWQQKTVCLNEGMSFDIIKNLHEKRAYRSPYTNISFQ